ncbi:hypothetical protein [uncultured Gilvimarinus sp.]|uniref:hypothetical protein n=1 Tax=uncultured Gilvimarinus sp. TaxID=1689143 RepID=UPI0030EE922A
MEPVSDQAMALIKSQPPVPTVWMAQKDKRTDKQNNYLNGYYYRKACELLNDAGHNIAGFSFTRDRLHAMCQQMFLVVEEVPLPGGKISYLFESTTKMNKARFTEYVDEQVAPWLLNDYEISVPPPVDEYYRMLWNEIYQSKGRML